MLLDMLAGLPLGANLLLFALFAAGIWIAGTRLTHYADEISHRTRIARAMMGLVFLATATELPEIATTLTSALEDNAALVLGNLFGGVSVNTAMLALADVLYVRAALTSYPRKPTSALEAVLLAILLAILLVIGTIGERHLIWGIGAGSLCLAVAYAMSIYLLRHYDMSVSWSPVTFPEDSGADEEGQSEGTLADVSLRRLIGRFAAASGVILLCGVSLVYLSETIAVQSGLGSSFVGVTFLALATSLPELSTTLTAVRLGAYTMALGNIFGSNLIMLALLFPADLFYRQGPILQALDNTAMVALLAGVIMTLVYLAGLIVRNQKKILGMGIDSAIVLCLFILSLFLFYGLT